MQIGPVPQMFLKPFFATSEHLYSALTKIQLVGLLVLLVCELLSLCKKFFNPIL